MTTSTPLGMAAGLVIPFVIYRVLGPIRARDPMLLVGSIFVLLRGVVSIAELVMNGKTDPLWIVAVIAVAYFVRARLRLLAAAPTRAADA